MSFLLSKCKELDYSALISINGGCSGSGNVLTGIGSTGSYAYPTYGGNCSGSAGVGSKTGSKSSLEVVKPIEGDGFFINPPHVVDVNPKDKYQIATSSDMNADKYVCKKIPDPYLITDPGIVYTEYEIKQL